MSVCKVWKRVRSCVTFRDQLASPLRCPATSAPATSDSNSDFRSPDSSIIVCKLRRHCDVTRNWKPIWNTWHLCRTNSASTDFQVSFSCCSSVSVAWSQAQNSVCFVVRVSKSAIKKHYHMRDGKSCYLQSIAMIFLNEFRGNPRYLSVASLYWLYETSGIFMLLESFLLNLYPSICHRHRPPSLHKA